VEYRGLDLVDWCTAVHSKISKIKMILFLATAFFCVGISAGALLSLWGVWDYSTSWFSAPFLVF